MSIPEGNHFFTVIHIKMGLLLHHEIENCSILSLITLKCGNQKKNTCMNDYYQIIKLYTVTITR